MSKRDVRWYNDLGEPYMIPVHAKALYDVLEALYGFDHQIRELQATMDLGTAGLIGKTNPIVQLREDYEAFRKQLAVEKIHGRYG